MKRLLRRSCLGLLLLVFFGVVVALLVFAVVFQQSQAISSNSAATITAKSTATRHPVLSTPIAVTATIPLPIEYITAPSNGDVTIQVETTATDIPTNNGNALIAPSNTPGLLSTAASMVTATDVPRYSGTSSYPLTVTAEVMLAQTHVANYQSGVGATRTAIAAESIGIFETLTAGAPTPTPGAS
jgi:hypothetical protein